MLPVICRCCGGIIGARELSANINLCAACERTELDESPRAVMPEDPSLAEVSASQAPAELEHLLEIDGPSVVEFTNAVEQAQQAIAEVLAEERAAREKAGASQSLRAPPEGSSPQTDEAKVRSKG